MKICAEEQKLTHSPFLPLLRNLQRYNIFHSCGQCMFSNTFLCCSPTTSGCCQGWQQEYIFHLERTLQKTLVGCHHQLESSDTGQKWCPKFDWKLKCANRSQTWLTLLQRCEGMTAIFLRQWTGNWGEGLCSCSIPTQLIKVIPELLCALHKST